MTRDFFRRTLEKWFITEPALFTVMCMHSLKENTEMNCPIRSGHRTVEYNPLFTEQMDESTLEEALKTEAIRILLLHPYSRKPEGCCDTATATGSNLTIADNFRTPSRLNLTNPEDFGLDKGQCYEWYSRQIQERLPKADGTNGRAGDNSTDNDSDTMSKVASSDIAGLWEDDPMNMTELSKAIDSIKSWGSLPGNLVDTIKASNKAKIDWRNIFAGFRSSVLSSRTRLTRMRPNRRTGFLNPGTQREYSARILIALDVSGSVSNESLSHFFGIINRAFTQGVFAIDVMQFDTEIKSVQPMNRKRPEYSVNGRGGTNFQAPVKYAFEKKYDGLVILTDGYAPSPDIPKGNTKIMWVCEDKQSYERNAEWMKKTGRACFLQLIASKTKLPF